MDTSRISRREALRLGVGAVAVPLLAACGGTSQPAASGAAPPASAAAPASSAAASASASAKPSAATAASPAVSAAKPAGEIIVRSLGGAYQDAKQKAIFGPFSAATGIKVTAIAATGPQILASVQQGKAQLDVLDGSEAIHLALDQAGALDTLDYNTFTSFNLNDVDSFLRRPTMIGNDYFATIIGYRNDAFPNGGPKSWTDFWDLTKFPGPRTLEDQKGGTADLEAALIADGVPAKREAIYPIDIDRALKSMSKIRKGVPKFWDTGALSAELLDRKEVVLAAMWNGRIQDLIDKGAAMTIEWNQAKRQTDFWSIPKKAPNRDAAMKFIDFAMQPKMQAAFGTNIAYGPTNKQALQYIPVDAAKKLPSSPEHFAIGSDQDSKWWADSLKVVNDKWQAWLLQG